MMVSTSLFDAPVGDPVQESSGWITAVITGELAIALCTLAVAFLGFLLLTGRLPVRRGALIILGCFVLLGAPASASGISGVWSLASEPVPRMAASETLVIYEREELPPAENRPYARASLRRD